MIHVQRNAEDAVREMLKDLARRYGLKREDYLEAEDFMDDGARIHLKIYIDP